MKVISFLLILMFVLQSYSQANNKTTYLENNRFDLNNNAFDFPQKDFKILGFGAYHGSAKTEKVEFELLKSLTKDGTIKYYLPETDFSIGHYFNQYLKTGDTLLLKKLVSAYGTRVPQEKSIQTYDKWKEIKRLNDALEDSKKLNVLGVDLLVTYEFTSKHLLKLFDNSISQRASFEKLENMVRLDTTDYSPYYDSYSKQILIHFVNDYESNPMLFKSHINDQFAFNHIIENVKQTFTDFDNSTKREQHIFNNYTHLSTRYKFDENPQFLRFGFFHIEKDSEGNSVPFFKMLIDNDIYKFNDVISVIGYLTESNVLWDVIYEDNKYKSFTTEGGYGIGDYEKEYFLGIENLKKTKISDMTLYQLNKKDTPYNDGVPDLLEIVMEDAPSNKDLVKGKSTTNFMDYAVLISDSKANLPIEEMDKKNEK